MQHFYFTDKNIENINVICARLINSKTASQRRTLLTDFISWCFLWSLFKTFRTGRQFPAVEVPSQLNSFHIKEYVSLEIPTCDWISNTIAFNVLKNQTTAWMFSLCLNQVTGFMRIIIFSAVADALMEAKISMKPLGNYRSWQNSWILWSMCFSSFKNERKVLALLKEM